MKLFGTSRNRTPAAPVSPLATSLPPTASGEIAPIASGEIAPAVYQRPDSSDSPDSADSPDSSDSSVSKVAPDTVSTHH
eukprot:2919791-Prymnesium_polylepis.1